MRRFFLSVFFILTPLGFSQAVTDYEPIPLEVEIVYEKGLDYLQRTQLEDGTWRDGRHGTDPGVVGLSALAFLASGEDPISGKYAESIEKAALYIISAQDSSGFIGANMYNHGFATLALCELYGAIEVEGLKEAIDRSIKLIKRAQEENPLNAWRYMPDSTDADTTVTGCQLVALFAARNAGFAVSDTVIDKALKYLSECRNKNGSYGYTSASSGKPTLTAIAVLCQLLAKEEDSEQLQQSLEYLSKRINYRDEHYPFYFEYYMSQALFQADYNQWKEWNKRNIRYLEITQNSQGAWTSSFGSTYATSAALLSLALNYKYLPIYER